MLVAQAAYVGLNFGQHTVAVTLAGSELINMPSRMLVGALSPCGIGWVVNSVNSLVVGLLPAALQGIDIDGLLAGAQLQIPPHAGITLNQTLRSYFLWLGMYQVTVKETKKWLFCLIKHRLQLFSKYLQQLVNGIPRQRIGFRWQGSQSRAFVSSEIRVLQINTLIYSSLGMG